MRAKGSVMPSGETLHSVATLAGHGQAVSKFLAGDMTAGASRKIGRFWRWKFLAKAWANVCGL
jgi:hypothetical protein